MGNIYNNEFSLKSTWPIEAGAPIPLYCLLKAGTENCETFLEESLDNFRKSDFACKDLKISDQEKDYIRAIYPAFQRIKEYQVNCNHLSKAVIEKETMT